MCTDANANSNACAKLLLFNIIYVAISIAIRAEKVTEIYVRPNKAIFMRIFVVGIYILHESILR